MIYFFYGLQSFLYGRDRPQRPIKVFWPANGPACFSPESPTMCAPRSLAMTSRRRWLGGMAAGGLAASWHAGLAPRVRAAKGDVDAAIRENVKLQAQTLVEDSTVISSLVSAGKVLVAGGIFDLDTNRVEPVHLG
jgi:hypothetical protein